MEATAVQFKFEQLTGRCSPWVIHSGVTMHTAADAWMYFLLTLPSRTPILCLQRPLLRDATLIHRLSWELYIHTSLLLIRPPKKNKKQRTNVTNIIRLFSFVFIDSFKSSKCDVNGQHVHVKVTFNQLTVLSDFHLNFKHTPYQYFFFPCTHTQTKRLGSKDTHAHTPGSFFCMCRRRANQQLLRHLYTHAHSAHTSTTLWIFLQVTEKLQGDSLVCCLWVNTERSCRE